MYFQNELPTPYLHLINKFLLFNKLHTVCNKMEMTSQMGIVDQGVKKDNSLDIFEIKTNISEPIMELINKEFFNFQALSSGCQRHEVSISMVRKT